MAPRGKTSRECGRHRVGRWAAGSARWRTCPPRPRAPPGADRCRPRRTPGKMARSISHSRPGAPKCSIPWCAMPGITLENASPTESAGNRNTKPASGPADADVEQHALGIDRRAHADESAERAQERRRQKVRQAGIHAVIQRRQSSGRIRGPAGWAAESAKTASPAADRAGDARTSAYTRRRCSTSNGRLRSKSICMAAPTTVVVSSVSANSRPYSQYRSRVRSRREGEAPRRCRFRRREGTARARNPGRTQ